MVRESTRRVSIHVAGVVQGVGFRPLVHRHAKKLGLKGSVRNTSGSVDIDAEGPSRRIERLIGLLEKGPPNARVGRVDVVEAEPRGGESFRPLASGGARSVAVRHHHAHLVSARAAAGLTEE